MALIILLILTEDDAFNRSIHEVVGWTPFDASFFRPVRACRRRRLPSPFPRLTGAEEHHLVHGEIVDGDLARQLAHPGRHPHHPVQHDPNKGGFDIGFYI